MTLFQIMMLGASAFFAYKVYEHVQTLQETPFDEKSTKSDEKEKVLTYVDTSDLIFKADEELEKGNLDKALAIYSEANIKDPKNDETLFKMGYTLVKQGRDEEAQEYFVEALEIDAENPFTHLELAKLYKRQNKIEEATKHLSLALAIDAEFEPAHKELQSLQEEEK